MQRSLSISDHTSSRSRDQGIAAPQSDLNSHPSTLNSPRRGFTLIELAIVIGIMGLLVTILVVAIRPGLITAREAAVKTTLLRIGDVIQQRVQAINNLDVSVEAKKLAALNGWTEAQATFILKKNLYRQALPQRKEDLWGFDQQNDSGGNDDAPFIVGVTWIATAPANDRALSSAMLHLALVDGKSVRALPGGQAYPMPTLTEDGIKTQHHREVTTLGADVEAFYDEWDQPLRFYNFPTSLVAAAYSADVATKARLQALLPGLPAANGRDPLDPTGLSKVPFVAAWGLTYAPSVSLTPVPVVFNAVNYHTPDLYYLPLLVSSGPDQELGIGEPNSATPADRLGSIAVPAPDTLDDNITSQQR